ncbi:hypothetical protein DACRYDRAFT_118772 [Dacryopinax primogenitus]|uniref:Rab-GAP TBC domain-containing protein n=1 Tax=Dacryopinax primogenitus (strain DJM 731) TaxID=1858805 RepID=M5FY75_DACPD|nr:uncharacterized protein DACRYDRAFT_118772 [Dacryopinax primogenitus]EJT98511.1 hypothetical protein DACRYDRAFT_118772 [Dacryopinax primogenitus]
MEDYERLHQIESLLDPSSAAHLIVDRDEFRSLCVQGIPDEPSWIRTRAWKLLLDLIPNDKTTWNEEDEKAKTKYWALVDGIAEGLDKKPPPTRPLSPADRSLIDLAFSLPSLPLLPEPVSPQRTQHVSPVISITTPDLNTDELLPPTPIAQVGVDVCRGPSTTLLLNRLALVMTMNATRGSTVALRGTPSPPMLTISAADDTNTSPPISASSRHSLGNGSIPRTPRSLRSPGSKKPQLSKSERRSLALLRILHAHSILHASHPPVTFLIPLVSALYELCHSAYNSAVSSDSDEEAEEVEHDNAWDEEVEAEAFWFLEAIRDRMGDVWEVNDACDEILRTIELRLARIDEPFARELLRKSLAPSTSEYSVKWLSSVLAASLPPPVLLITYDSLFGLPPTAFVAALIDVFLALMILLRPQLFAAGRAKGDVKPNHLWVGEEGMEDEEAAKRQGESILDQYPIDEVGSDRILRAASEIRMQREWEERRAASGWTTEAVASRLLRQQEGQSANGGGIIDSFRGFAETLKQSDTAASLSKASTNWKASALQAWRPSPPSLTAVSQRAASPSPLSRPSSWGSVAMKLWNPLRASISSLPDGIPLPSPLSAEQPTPEPPSQSPQIQSDVSTTTSRAESPNPSIGSPPSTSRSLPSLQAALNSIINSTPAPSPLSLKKPPPRSLMLSGSARPPSIQRYSRPRLSEDRSHDSISSTFSSTSRRTTSLSNASDSDNPVVKLRGGVSPRSPAGMALRQKREFSSPARLVAPANSVPVGMDIVLSPDSYISSPSLPTPAPLNSVASEINEAVNRWTLSDTKASPGVTRSSSNSSLGSAYQGFSPQVPIPSPGLRRNRRIADQKPPGLRLRDTKAVAADMFSPLSSTTDGEEQGPLTENGDSLLPYARMSLDDGERTPEPKTPRPSVSLRRSPSPAVKREAKKKHTDDMVSEEEGMKADEEDNTEEQVVGGNYNDILSAYEDE